MANVAERDEDCSRVVQVLKAIAHPLRLRIVAILCNKAQHVSALSAELGVNQAVVSQQLRILRMSGLVESSREEGFAVYRIAEPRIKNLIKCVERCCA